MRASRIARRNKKKRDYKTFSRLRSAERRSVELIGEEKLGRKPNFRQFNELVDKNRDLKENVVSTDDELDLSWQEDES
jgi:hypothetical protein